MNGPPAVNACTWVECENRAVHDQVGRDGATWSRLCNEHNTVLHDALRSGDARLIMSVWIKAQGGARAATDRMRPAIEVGTRLLEFLRGDRTS